jgi:TolB-like protein
VFHYKAREVDPRIVGKDLKVQAVVTGRIVQHGERLIMRHPGRQVFKAVRRPDVVLTGSQAAFALRDTVTAQSDARLIVLDLRVAASGC